MKKTLGGIVLLLLLVSVFYTPRANCKDCASASTSSVQGNCVVRDWTVCCAGPGPGEVSCFEYRETVYCANQ